MVKAFYIIRATVIISTKITSLIKIYNYLIKKIKVKTVSNRQIISHWLPIHLIIILEISQVKINKMENKKNLLTAIPKKTFTIKFHLVIIFSLLLGNHTIQLINSKLFY